MGWAQSLPQAPTGSPTEVLERARQIYAEQGPRAALPEFEHALALFHEVNDRRNEAVTLGYIGNCYKRFGDFTRSLEYHRRALTMKQELGDRLEEGKTLSHLGLVFWEMGDYAQAIEHLTRSIGIGREVGDRRLEAAALNNLSLVYDEQGDYRRSLEQYHLALELHRATNFPQGEGATLGNIGGVYLLLGQYREAMRYYQQSLAISERLNLKPSASQDLGNLALCHLGLGQVEEALASFDRALALAREAGLKKEEADWHKGKGSALTRTGKYGPALEEYQLALDGYRQAGLKRELVEGLNDLGTLHLVLGDAASAEKSFRQALELARAIGNPRGVTFNLFALGNLEWRKARYEQAAALYREAHAQAQKAEDQTATALSLLQLALTHRDLGRLEEARQAAQEALEISRAIGARPLEAQALYALGDVARVAQAHERALQHFALGEQIAQTFGDPDLLWRLAYGRGRALEALGRDEEAVAAYREAITTIESVRGQLQQERFRAGYIEDKYQVYVALVRLLLKLGLIDQAFQTAEKLRARSYLDLLHRGPPLVHNEAQREAEAALRERVRRLQDVIKQENEKPQPEQRGQALDLFSRELAEAERAFHALLDDLRRTEPEYAAALALDVPPTEQVQLRLPPDAALLEYLVGEDSLTIFVVTGRELRAKTLPVRTDDLNTKVELLRDLIVREKSPDWEKPALSLRRLLIAPLEQEGWLDGIRRLYLVPHGILHYVPFAALANSEKGRKRFLVNDYVLAYLPTAAALTHAKEPSLANGTLFAVAPLQARLQFAEQEVRTIGQNFASPKLVLVGKQATEAAFKQQADRFQVLHLASHGYFNKLNPLLSGVELEAGGREDGRLEVHEILALRLNAKLVTLSACNTALESGYFAEVPPGDDLVGLTRAFLFAGSPSVLATLWEVNDRSTLQLMRGVYGQLPRNGKATALAQAQRSMLRGKGRFAHPYFWAPFVLVGKMD